MSDKPVLVYSGDRIFCAVCLRMMESDDHQQINQDGVEYWIMKFYCANQDCAQYNRKVAPHVDRAYEVK